MKLTNLNWFLMRDVTDGRKSCSEGLLKCHYFRLEKNIYNKIKYYNH